MSGEPGGDQRLRAAARDLLDTLQAAAEAGDADEPHVLLETDPQTGSKQVFGPYRDAYAAVLAAAERRKEWAQHIGEPMAVWEPVLFVPADGDPPGT